MHTYTNGDIEMFREEAAELRGLVTVLGTYWAQLAAENYLLGAFVAEAQR